MATQVYTLLKQGLNLLMPVKFGISLDDVEKIDFVIKQGSYYLPTHYEGKQIS